MAAQCDEIPTETSGRDGQDAGRGGRQWLLRVIETGLCQAARRRDGNRVRWCIRVDEQVDSLETVDQGTSRFCVECRKVVDAAFAHAR